MSHFICPVCSEQLYKNPEGKSLSCPNNHSFDIAKSGYVNLLMSQQPKEKRHGDDQLMVRARRDFLEKGYYQPLLDKLLEAADRHAVQPCTILDAGCGECWYTSGIYEHLVQQQKTPSMLGIDISKHALTFGAKRNRDIKLAVASAFHLPVRSLSCDIVLSVFAPFSSEEFGRVLKRDGLIIRVIPLEKHLYSLKTAIYDKAYDNTVEQLDYPGFELVSREDIKDVIHLKSNEDILQVFSMTPYYYKTGATDQQKLTELESLDTEIEFGILTYRKI